MGQECVARKCKTGASMIRLDYRKEVRWTYAEAADFAQVTVNAVRIWASRGKFKRGFAVGPLKVDAASFQRFLTTGQPQK